MSDDELDELFKLPLAEFTIARNALAVRLKKEGSKAEAERVKSLAKPSVSAWAVNQIYWKHREQFNQLITAGERFAQAHASQLSGTPADTRGPLEARREALSSLARLADKLLRDAGHNPASDTMRRITTTLEALSASSSMIDARRAGRLTEDIDPPGFDSFTALIPEGGVAHAPGKSATILPSESPAISESKAALEAAERKLRETQTRVQEGIAQAEETDRNRREAEEHLKKATAAAEHAYARLHSLHGSLAEAERQVEKARQKWDRLTKRT
jgi:hypothetical protein